MIVVPTFNGYWQLHNLIKSLEKYGTNGHSVLIVDNGTSDVVSLKYLRELGQYVGSFDILVEKNKHGKYETGALIHAVREYPNEEKFILIHDGCVAQSSHWLTQFEEKLTPEAGAVVWVKFSPCLFAVFPPHREWMESVGVDLSNVPDGGVFGSIFMTYGSILREWDAKGKFNCAPQTKLHAECWERIWAIYFHQEGYKVNSLINEFNPTAIHFGQYPHLRKTFKGRG